MNEQEYLDELTVPVKLRASNQEQLNAHFLSRILTIDLQLQQITKILEQLTKGKNDGITNDEK